MIDLSIIILSYKSKEDLVRLLPSVFLSDEVSFSENSALRFQAELIVVDNGSNDGTLEWLQAWHLSQGDKRVKIIKNINNGFAAGNNLGIAKAKGRYILLLNPDTEINPDTLAEVLGFMERTTQAGICGSKVVRIDGSLDLACKRRFPNPWNAFLRLFLLSKNNYNKLDTNENEIQEVDSVMGAFLLIRKSVVEKIGPLDEDFFMYGEDIDWCWRCKEAGFQVWYYPETQITHYKGSSSKKVPEQAINWFHEAMWIFYQKHYSKKYPAILNLIVWLGIKLRLGLLIILNYFKKDKIVSK